ncbi:MAG: Flp pilus assembly protein CpaB [Phycisphaeraceae bacterium]|nr:Flp pilus assembly protein CpaB [Phycisphaeraceae bacterium]
MKASIITLVALGMVAAFCAALLTASMGKAKTASKQTLEPISVLIATRDMPSMTIVTEDSFEQSERMPDELPQGAIGKPLMIMGKPLARAVVKGQPLTRDCFALDSLGVEMVAKMPKGKRAMTVDLALASGLEGLLYPGCVVDVLATFKIDPRNSGEGLAVSTTLLQGIEVIAIDSETISVSSDSEQNTVNVKNAEETSLRRKTRRVTLLVDPRQAEALQLATEHGTVALAMRNPLDSESPDQDPTLLNQGKLASLAEYLGASVPRHTKAAPSTPVAATEGDTVETAPAAPSTPVVSSDITSRRDIIVLRGTAIEVRSLSENEQVGVEVATRN